MEVEEEEILQNWAELIVFLKTKLWTRTDFEKWKCLEMILLIVFVLLSVLDKAGMAKDLDNEIYLI